MLPEYCYSTTREIDVKGIVVHYFSAVNVDDNGLNPENCRNLVLDLNRPEAKREWYSMPDFPDRMYASYHAMIDREGKLMRLVPDDCVAYHAGQSEYKGLSGLNEYSLGAALIASHSSGFTDAQYKTLNDYINVKKKEHNIEWVTGHENITSRKKDPGPKFDWSRICGST